MAGQALGDGAEVTEITAAPPVEAVPPVSPEAVVPPLSPESPAADALAPEAPAADALAAEAPAADAPAAEAPSTETSSAEAPGAEGPAAPEAAERRRRGFRLLALMGRHRFFSVIFGLGLVLRVITMIGYGPAMWFNDSFDYLNAALRFYPHPLRPDGYSFMLLLLYPLHSFVVVVGVQHAMGLACGLMVYALLRTRFGLPAWGATLCAAPVILDAYQIQLEQLILSDVLFEFLAISALTIILWRARPTWKMGAWAGLLIGLAGITRSLAPAVLVAVVVYLLTRRTNWRVIVAAIVLCAVPMGLYSTWYYSRTGKFSTTGTSGIFLYARVAAFADCNKIKNLPAADIPLCYIKPPKVSQDAIWDYKSPLLLNSPNKWSAYQNQLTSDYSKRAIMAQPGDYLRTVAGDFFRTFKWDRTVFPDRNTFNEYQFRTKENPLPTWSMPGGGTSSGDAHQYENGNAQTRVREPFAGIMRFYQRYVYMRGTWTGILLLIGLGGMLPLWRRFGGRALLPWVTAIGLLLAPAATAEFDYRYVLPAIPVAAIGAGLAFTPETRAAYGRLFRRRPASPDSTA